MREKVAIVTAVFCVSTGLLTAASTKNVKIHGYVTAVTSPTNFEIEDYRITSDQGLALDFDNAEPDVKFALQDLRVGVGR